MHRKVIKRVAGKIITRLVISGNNLLIISWCPGAGCVVGFHGADEYRECHVILVLWACQRKVGVLVNI